MPHAALSQTEHRPWPLPGAPWVMSMTWDDVLFAHWPVPVDELRRVVPEALALDTHEGSAWLGVVPFVMAGVRSRGWPRAWGWRFAELNVRTYVTVNGKPGVYFFSLDAASRLAVRAARWSWGLPYFDAAMSCEREDDGWVTYTSRRTHRSAAAADFAGRYRPTGEVQHAQSGSFEHFATERYCLYTVNRRGQPMRGEIHHAPWPLQPAEAAFDVLAISEQIGMALPDSAPRLHFAQTLDVIAWLPAKVEPGVA